MKLGFYPRLAFDGIRKNKRLYVPYILTCIGMVMMYYIIIFLKYDETLKALPGAVTINTTVGLGAWVVALFACLFLFYTNAFLIRRRKKEFGLYSILGMGKKNIGLILFWEAVIIALASIVLGLVAGISFSKLAELGLVYILKGKVDYNFYVSPDGIFMAIAVFGAVFLLIFLNSLRQVKFSTAVDLLKSEKSGEKPPKGNWLFGLAGVIILAAAYYIAVTIKDPVAALLMFFVAVIMVIVATYLIMISGSVVFCRLLQKNKGYYYKTNHFVSVASMTYRMKRNGAGLASICILATMVLVMISSTTALYTGSEDVIRSRYPHQLSVNLSLHDAEKMDDAFAERVRQDLLGAIAEKGGDDLVLTDYRAAYFSAVINDGIVESSSDNTDLTNLANVFGINIIPLADYNRIAGTDETLDDDQVLIYVENTVFRGDTLGLKNGTEWSVKQRLDSFPIKSTDNTAAMPTMVIVVPDFQRAVAGYIDAEGDRVMLSWNCGIDTRLSGDAQMEMYGDIRDLYHSITMADDRDDYMEYGYGIYCREAERSDFYGIFGGLFYLGIVLSIVFIFATVLIIYYKQISEGYEDQSRFEIMQKVGMTEDEIRSSINSQLLTVFFLPLMGAGLHLAFAFPMIRKILLLFNLNNVELFAITTVVSFIIFAFLYVIVYKLTSNAYYNIVSDAGADK